MDGMDRIDSCCGGGRALDRQIAAQAAAFQRHGGFAERLTRVRRDERGY